METVRSPCWRLEGLLAELGPSGPGTWDSSHQGSAEIKWAYRTASQTSLQGAGGRFRFGSESPPAALGAPVPPNSPGPKDSAVPRMRGHAASESEPPTPPSGAQLQCACGPRPDTPPPARPTAPPPGRECARAPARWKPRRSRCGLSAACPACCSSSPSATFSRAMVSSRLGPPREAGGGQLGGTALRAEDALHCSRPGKPRKAAVARSRSRPCCFRITSRICPMQTLTIRGVLSKGIISQDNVFL